MPIQNENNEENNINANNNDINENVELIFKSRYHAHDLKYKSLYYEDWECCECLNSFEKKTKTGYNCSECGFNICSKCKALEKSGYIIYDAIGTLHHKHILRENIINKDYICDICKKCFNGLKTTYGCHKEKCNFDLCIECLKKETPEIKEL